MNPANDKRLIEDYLPIVDISAEASREKSVRKGHISTLHLWWARRPLVACRAAVYAALVPASQFVPGNGTDAQKKSLGRANAARFVKRLCRYPSGAEPEIAADIQRAVAEAQEHILKAHAQRLTHELQQAGGTVSLSARQTGGEGRGEVGSFTLPAWVAEFKWPANKTTVTVADILAGRAPRPRVLDMFAGGGAVPLEALRLGCEAYALDLNPVAHIIQLCTLVYPQKFGKPDPNERGMTGPKNAQGQTTWGGLAEEVRYWGKWVLEKVRSEIGDLYPLIPDPEFTPPKNRKGDKDDDAFAEPQHVMAFADDSQQRLKARTGFLTPVAYLWSRTVRCKNPGCGATVPLVKQTWLCKKEGRYVALKVIAPRGEKRVRFEVVEARSAAGLGFDPEAFSKGGNATCPFCGTVADSDYVKEEGCAARMQDQLMTVVCTRPGKQGKVYLATDTLPNAAPDDAALQERIEAFCQRTGLAKLEEPMPKPGTLGFRIQPYGYKTWGDMFTPRQMLSLMGFAAAVKSGMPCAMEAAALDADRAKAVSTVLAVVVDRLADFNSAFCTWNYTGGRGVLHTYARHALPMVWDFAETNPFNPDAASWVSGIDDVPAAFECEQPALAAHVARGSATNLPWPDTTLDAVITDPPYYDNVPYADISDFFYVWLRRTVGDLYPQHFAASATPKKQEAIAEPIRHEGSMDKARSAYEEMMSQSFREAQRVLKSGGQLVVVYAHKTTLGWATLVDALRKAGFIVTQAWPLDTEKPGRLRSMDSAALASSIFLVARKRDGTKSGNYDEEVRPELESIVRERVETLWGMGISGADLVIASVGAGLRAFTRFARVEYANGEEVRAERFLTEVETVVLDHVLARLAKEAEAAARREAKKAGNEPPADPKIALGHVDAATRFYILWRYTYGAAELEAGEAIIFANGTHVELDSQHGLTTGADALVEKKKSKYRLRDFTERGADKGLGLPTKDGQSAPLVDTLHRALWLMEKRPAELPGYLRDAQPNREQLRLVAQALAGPALKGGELGDVSPTAELSALGKLTANWQNVIEDAALTTGQREEKKVGQKQLI